MQSKRYGFRKVNLDSTYKRSSFGIYTQFACSLLMDINSMALAIQHTRIYGRNPRSD